MRLVSIRDVEEVAVSCLGFNVDSADLLTPEVLAALVRKTASFECPCPRAVLAKSVFRLLEPICPGDTLKDTVRGTVNSVTSYGDLVEMHEPSDTASNFLLYLAAPSFLQVSDTLFLLFGVTPDGEDMTPPDLRQRVEPVMYSRRLAVQDPKECRDTLLQAGFESLKLDSWLRCPSRRTASELIALYDDALLKSGPPGVPEDVILIDPTRAVSHYKRRWTKLKKQSGRSLAGVAAYGSHYHLPRTAMDSSRASSFPAIRTHWRAFDEAWHLLQAIDAVSGQPQGFRVRKTSLEGVAAMDLFSPVPSWRLAGGMLSVSGQCQLSLVACMFPEKRIDAEYGLPPRYWLRRL